MSAAQFQSCSLEPIEGGDASSVSCVNGKWKSSSFFLDSSGRSVVAVPLRLCFSSEQLLDEFLSANCIHPLPENATDTKNSDESEEQTANGRDNPRKRIGIEARVTLTSGNGQAITAKVEGVQILSVRVEDALKSLAFNTEIIVRVSHGDDGKQLTQIGDVKANLDVGASFTEYAVSSEDPSMSALQMLDSLNQAELATHQHPSITHLTSFPLQVTLTHALEIAVRSIPGPTMGQTFVALRMKHSNSHHQPVTITAIALHPGVSWYTRQNNSQPSDAGVTSPKYAATSVVTADLSSIVHWGYAPGCAPDLPITLQPREAVSVCFSIEAKEDTISRLCACPLSITAEVVLGRERHEIVAADEAVWQTARTAVEPADAFRVDLRIEETSHRPIVGSPVTVALDITNLHPEVKQLMLLVDQPTGSGKWSIVSEKGGQKFGLVGGDDERSELLVVDNALILGEVKGHSSLKGQLRFIPLKEGPVNVPNFKLIDSRTGKRYSCSHKLQTVAVASQ